MKYRYFLLLVCFFIVGIINAQTDFRPGYIIKMQGDTTFGEIDYRGDLLMGEYCYFRISEQEDAVNYSPEEIIAYRFTDDKYFVSRDVFGRKYFLEYLINGEVDIFYLREEKADHYFIEKEGKDLLELPYEETYIRNKDNMGYIHRSKKHIGILNIYMNDAQDFQKNIAGIGKPNHENLIKLAKDYHNNVCEDDMCIVYKKEIPIVKLDFEVLGGIINFAHLEDLNDINYFQTGAVMYITMPGLNEKMYIKVGVLVATPQKLNGDKYRHLRIPLHIGYIAPKTYAVRPYASIGIYSPSYTIGARVKLNKKIYVGIQANASYSPDKFPLIPEELFHRSLLANVFIDL